jgi:hypothetical protein
MHAAGNKSERRRMKLIKRIIVGIVCGSLTSLAWANNTGEDLIVSPQVIVLDNNTTPSLTLHAGTDFDAQAEVQLVITALNGTESVSFEPTIIYADALGDLVAKFDAAEIKEVLKESGPGVYLFDLQVKGSDGVYTAEVPVRYSRPTATLRGGVQATQGRGTCLRTGPGSGTGTCPMDCQLNCGDCPNQGTGCQPQKRSGR